jgi:fructose-bisphosphate aldolase class I
MKIIEAIDMNQDGDLSKDEMVQFFHSLAAALPVEQRPDRAAEDEAEGLVKEFGDGEKIPAAKFQEFLQGFCTEEPDKAELILRGLLFGKMLDRVKNFDGFLAALDQSGGSTPKALRAYGVEDSEYNGEEEMFDQIHKMRTRIVSCPAFNGDDVLGAILFEMTMDRDFAIGDETMPAAQYLWEKLNVVPFVKCDKGLADEENDCQLMKPTPDLDALMIRARSKGVFGTKERSLIKKANRDGIRAVVAQQFEMGKQIIGHGLCPIIEPEVDINSETKAEAEEILKEFILEELNALDDSKNVMLKLTIPTVDNLYQDLVNHPRVVKVVALSGGYARDEANERLAKNNGMVASFSRALTEGLNAKMTDEEYNAALEVSIKSIHAASST